MPSKYVLTAVAIVCALALLANAISAGRASAPAVFPALAACGCSPAALVVVVVASTVVGSALPALVYKFREAPSAAKLDLERDRPQPEGHRSRRSTSTRTWPTVPYNPSTTLAALR